MVDVWRRGNFIAYRSGETNRCPGCGRCHWYVGRLSAECCFCATALPLIDTVNEPEGATILRIGRPAVIDIKPPAAPVFVKKASGKVVP